MQYEPRPTALVRYAVAILLTGVAAGITLLLEPYLQTFTFALFFAAVAISAWFGGRGPGVLAAGLSVAAMHFFFLAPPESYQVDGVAELLRLGVVFFVALLISALSESLHRSRGAAERAERYIRGVLEGIQDPVIIYDPEWRYRYLNAAAAASIRESGRVVEDLIGSVVWEERPELIGTTFEREIRDARDSGEPRTFEEHESSSDRWHELTCYRLSGGDVATVRRDITGRKREERRRSFLAEAGATLENELDTREILSCVTSLSTLAVADYAIAYTAAESDHLQRVSVAHPDPEKRKLLLDIERIGPLHVSHEVLGRAIDDGEPLLSTPVRVEEIAIAPEHERLARALAPRSAILAPVFAHGQPIGLLVFATTQGGKPPLEERDRELIAEVAHRAGLAISVGRARDAEHAARRQAERAAERMGRLQSATASLASAATEKDVRAAALEHAAAGVGADAAATMGIDAHGSALQLLETVNWPAEAVKRFDRLPLMPESVIMEAIRTQEVVCAGSPKALVAVDPTLEKLMRHLGTSTVMAVALRASGETVAALILMFEQAEDCSNEDLDFLAALSQACVQALDRARLYEAIRLSAEENARLYEKTRLAVRARDEVLAFVSHDLRNSLVVVTGAVRRLLGGGLVAEKRTEILERIAMAADQMQRLIRDLLTVSQAEAGRLELELSRVDIEDLVREACDLATGLAEERGVSIHYEVESHLPLAAIDRGRMLDVLQNLLGNAMKFTRAGGRIELRVGRQADGLIFEVADSGEGIPAEEIPHIFDRFWHTRGSGRGAGLGLAICKGIIEAHGGRIRVESEKGRGSTFTFIVPSTIHAHQGALEDDRSHQAARSRS